jgi:hypothetical protein
MSLVTERKRFDVKRSGKDRHGKYGLEVVFSFLSEAWTDPGFYTKKVSKLAHRAKAKKT